MVFKCTVSELMIFTFGSVPFLDIMPINDVAQKKQIQLGSGVHNAQTVCHFGWFSSVIFWKHIFVTRNYKIICYC